jgi:hypothetical protein
VAFVNVAQEEIGARELVATVLAFVGFVAGVCGEALAMEEEDGRENGEGEIGSGKGLQVL